MDNYGFKLMGHFCALIFSYVAMIFDLGNLCCLGLFVHKFSSRNPSQLSLNFSRDQLSVRGRGDRARERGDTELDISIFTLLNFHDCIRIECLEYSESYFCIP